MAKKEWQRGEKTDVVAEIVRMYLKGNFRASIQELCEVVRKEAKRRRLGIELTSSSLKSIIMADKRPFCFVKTQEGTVVTLEKALLLEALWELAGKSKASRKVRDIRSAGLFKRSA